MKKHRILLTVALLIGATLLTACGGQSNTPPAQNNNPTTTTADTPVNTSNTTASPYVTTSPNAVLLTASDAEGIALTHAGVSLDSVRDVHTEFEVDDGVAYYEVSFRESATAYDYDIHAESGAILDVDIEYDKNDAPSSEQPTITDEQAKAAALSHAGLDADAVTQLRVEYDGDERTPHYDVSFRNGNYEYDYEIDAQTGDVISYDKDRDD